MATFTGVDGRRNETDPAFGAPLVVTPSSAYLGLEVLAATAVTLADGRVLIAGGAALDLFDSATESFAPAGRLTVDRRDYQVARLASGLCRGSTGPVQPADLRSPLASGSVRPRDKD